MASPKGLLLSADLLFIVFEFLPNRSVYEFMLTCSNVALVRISEKQKRLRRWGIFERNKYVPFVEYWKYAFDHRIIEKNDPELWNVFLWAIYHAYETYFKESNNPYKELIFFFIDEKFTYDRNQHTLLSIFNNDSGETCLILILLSSRGSLEEFKTILLYCEYARLDSIGYMSPLSACLVYSPNIEIKKYIMNLMNIEINEERLQTYRLNSNYVSVLNEFVDKIHLGIKIRGAYKGQS